MGVPPNGWLIREYDLGLPLFYETFISLIAFSSPVDASLNVAGTAAQFGGRIARSLVDPLSKELSHRWAQRGMAANS